MSENRKLLEMNLPHKRSYPQSQSEIDPYGTAHFYGLMLAFAVGYTAQKKKKVAHHGEEPENA